MSNFFAYSYRSLIVLIFWGTLAGHGHAQIIYQLNSDPAIQPLLLLSSVDEYIPEAEVSDSLDSSLSMPSLAVRNQISKIDLVLATLRKRRVSLFYRKGDSLAQYISEDDDLRVTGEDLPSDLFDDSWTITLPVSLNGDMLALSGGASITSDREDLSNEDYNSVIAFNYLLNPDSDVSWRFGVFQRSFLGEITPVYPLGEVAFREPDFEVAIGAIHLPELPSVAVVPFFRFTQKTKMDFSIEVLYPLKLSVFALFFENMSAELILEKQTNFYRLSQKDPWDSSVFKTVELHSALEVGYHFWGIFLLKAGVGVLSDRKYSILDKDLDSITNFSLESNPFLTSNIALAIAPLAD
ncbi:MAG: hypothetical protein HQM14_05560 [SAR324 cluster bacterium]|nr:hypothetical protein [SAR324 cluster bacterium]